MNVFFVSVVFVAPFLKALSALAQAQSPQRIQAALPSSARLPASFIPPGWVLEKYLTADQRPAIILAIQQGEDFRTYAVHFVCD